MTESSVVEHAVDVSPFAASQRWTSQHDYELWWDDPRDVCRVVARFDPGCCPDGASVRLEYWQQTWPKVRVPKGADVGSGSEGWLAIDDWTNGRWQTADCEFTANDHVLDFTFRPLNLNEFPSEHDFPAEFRRTIKLRLHFGLPQCGLRQVHVYTDSTWRDAELVVEWCSPDGNEMVWDGHAEAFNGEVLSVTPLTADTRVQESGVWQSATAGQDTGGVRIGARYAHSEDSNSYDRTILTVRSAVHSLSVSVDEALREPVYIRDLGVLVSRADLGIRLRAYEASWEQSHDSTLYQRVGELPEQTWERAWADMPTKGQFYFVLGCEGGRQKFGVEPNGEVFLGENFIRRVPGKDTPRLGWDGRELRYGFGLPQTASGDRSILDGYLPVIHTAWVDGSLCYEQEAYATWLEGDILNDRMEGDDPVVAMMRIKVTNRSAGPVEVRLPLTATVDGQGPQKLEARDGLVYADGPSATRMCYGIDIGAVGELCNGNGEVAYEFSVPSCSAHTFTIKLPFIDLTEQEELNRLSALSYDEDRERVIEFWRRRTAEGAQIETPNETLNNFYRTHLMHMLVINDREPSADRNVARCGGFHYGSFPDEGCMVIADLDRRGYHAEAERCLDLYIEYQGTAPLPGNFQSSEGVFYGSGGYEVAGYNRNQGWVLWCLAEHYRLTRDRAWLERAAPALIKGCDWITRERRATMVIGEGGRRPIDYGFLPTGSLEDVTDYWTWLSTNAYAYQGMCSAADVLAEIGHPEASRLRDDSAAYGDDLRDGFFEACARSPVVRLRDGTWVPHFPDRLQRRGRDFGWLREVLEGAAHLIYCGIIAPDEPAARWIIEDYEDNLFLSKQYGYQTEDFDRQWFSWGGFSMQPNLLIFPLIYLARDEPKHYLRSYFNPFASAFYPDTMMLTEHPLPTLADWKGDHFKSSDEALSTWWLRLMFLAEHGDTLFVGQAVPRYWLDDGKTIRIRRAMTHFGEVSLNIVSHVATGSIEVHLDSPTRNPPEQILLRLRHPECRPMRSVWVNGVEHSNFNIETETIRLDNVTGSMLIRVRY